VLPDAPAAPLLVLLELGPAHLYQVLDLLGIEVLVPYKRVASFILLDDPVAPQGAPDHVLGDFLVVLALALVVREDGPGDLLGEEAPPARSRVMSMTGW
jgi:hypothetical protein